MKLKLDILKIKEKTKSLRKSSQRVQENGNEKDKS
jgi:hypothetical protein